MKSIKILLAPIFCGLFILLFNLDSANPQITYMAAIAIWMAIWWITEAVPLAVTALLPLILFPLFGIDSTKNTAPTYINHIIFLFVGGFVISFAIEKWNLHKRIALKIIMLLGFNLERILLGFMLSSYFLSMWISNIATTMMMIPTALAVISRASEFIDKKHLVKFSTFILLGIAYSASIGGTASLIGTAPNLIFLSHYESSFPALQEITFGKWMLFGVPTSAVLLTIVYFLFAKIFMKGISLNLPNSDSNVFTKEYDKLGNLSYEEKIVGLIFILVGLLWMTRPDLKIGDFTLKGWAFYLPFGNMISDGTVAIFITVLLFVIPSKNKSTYLMDWETAKKVPLDIILLFGGGFALAKGFEISGLSEWIGSKLIFLEGVNTILIVIIICVFMTFITELTSNTATSQLILPILAATAISLNISPIYLMLPATISASYAFMLPVATPPNTIVFGTGNIKIKEMARVGLVINIIGIIVLTLSIMTLGKWLFI